MADVHYFPRYTQRENFVTNNTLLLFQRLYDYNLRKFGKFLMELNEDLDSFAGLLGLHINQQIRTGNSVPDGFIVQHPLKIVIETKMHEGFSGSQLRRHLNTNQEHPDLVLMLLSPRGEPSEKLVASLRNDKAKIVITSFRDIIGAARRCLSEHDEDMNALVDDYEAFCSESDLLPRDDYTLFIPPCGESYEVNARLKLYWCPDHRNIRKSKYLGIYTNKAVRHIGRIREVVSCYLNEDGTLNVIEGEPNSDEQERIKMAMQEGGVSQGHKFFLCSEMEETSFKKQTKGGMQRHRYFDLGAEVLEGDENVPNNLAELAEELRKIPWPF